MEQDNKTLQVDIAEVACEECPVSFITPTSRLLVHILIENKMHLDAAGACLFGANTMEWPQWWAKAVAIVQAQSVSVERARNEAK